MHTLTFLRKARTLIGDSNSTLALTTILALYLLISGIAQADAVTTKTDEALTHNYYEKTKIENLTVPDNAISFLTLGDWGRNGHFYQRPRR